MPELPEVETLRRALLPLVQGKVLLEIKLLRKDLRFPIPAKQLRDEALNAPIHDIVRRGKYLLFRAPGGTMIWHLGMSGRVIRYPSMEPAEKHTHVVFRFAPDTCLHFIDPRRFGCVLWAPGDESHPLLDGLGLEPFAPETTASALKKLALGRKAPIKSFLMDSRRLAGIGNIYACESLFSAGIKPMRQAGKLSLEDWDRLLDALRRTLTQSISAGGTTLRDFYGADGSAGYFALDLLAYGREGQPCPNCGAAIVRKLQSGRSTFYCKTCQGK